MKLVLSYSFKMCSCLSSKTFNSVHQNSYSNSNKKGNKFLLKLLSLPKKKEKSLRNMLHISPSRKKDDADYKTYSIKITASSREVCINKTYLFTHLFYRSVDRERCSFLWELMIKRDPKVCRDIKCHWSYTLYRELYTIYNGNNRCLNIAAQSTEAWFQNYQAHLLQEMRESWEIHKILVTIWHEETISRWGDFRHPYLGRQATSVYSKTCPWKLLLVARGQDQLHPSQCSNPDIIL